MWGGRRRRNGATEISPIRTCERPGRRTWNRRRTALANARAAKADARAAQPHRPRTRHANAHAAPTHTPALRQLPGTPGSVICRTSSASSSSSGSISPISSTTSRTDRPSAAAFFATTAALS